MDRLLRRRIKNLDSRVLKPTLRAYALGYLTTTGPRVVSFIRILRRKDLSNEVKVRHLAHILVAALRWNRFPSVCALLAAGSTLLPLLLNRVIAALFNRQKSKRVVLAGGGCACVYVVVPMEAASKSSQELYAHRVNYASVIGHWGIRCNRSYCYVGLVLCTRKAPILLW
ncbi:hypothetical protein CIHG_10014 [Coccidioides immitis H538.4]|uniref:Uncharacterized protein n=1 Tax=Coccidioides immitis H538.4 TaxID=396776 RepID=A0A0J8UWD4_COCIT|nr:hypothetical protein CIHG_10014 [Coccidioides immitis H538.4]